MFRREERFILLSPSLSLFLPLSSLPPDSIFPLFSPVSLSPPHSLSFSPSSSISPLPLSPIPYSFSSSISRDIFPLLSPRVSSRRKLVPSREEAGGGKSSSLPSLSSLSLSLSLSPYLFFPLSRPKFLCHEFSPLFPFPFSLFAGFAGLTRTLTEPILTGAV